MNQLTNWDQVTEGIQRRLSEHYKFPTGEVKSASNLVTPTNGPLGNRWEFDGGREIRIEVQSTQPLGAAGFDGSYEVFTLNRGGDAIPNLTRPNRASRPLGSLIAPMRTFRQTLRAPFVSQFGFRWKIRLNERTTSNNQSHLFFRVYRSTIS